MVCTWSSLLPCGTCYAEGASLRRQLNILSLWKASKTGLSAAFQQDSSLLCLWVWQYGFSNDCAFRKMHWCNSFGPGLAVVWMEQRRLPFSRGASKSALTLYIKYVATFIRSFSYLLLARNPTHIISWLQLLKNTRKRKQKALNQL